MNANGHSFPTFRQFFHRIHGGVAYPYPWQEALQDRVMSTGWPESISVPTGLGKTAAITVWLYELARQIHQKEPRTAPMRLFYVINRRMVIDQTHQYVNNLLTALQSETDGVLGPVRAALAQALPPGDDRLVVASSIHGEDPDDTSWMRATGPTIVSLAPNQFVSRLLMRGYGVSLGTRSMHAGLVGVDRLVLFDEPHLSLPAITTIRDQERIQSQADELVLPVGNTVLLGATMPALEGDKTASAPVFDLQKNLRDSSAQKRLEAKKSLTIDRLPTTSNAALAKAATGLVRRYAEGTHQRILVVLNTVGAAQAAFAMLNSNQSKIGDIPVRLLTSRFRPLDKRTDGLKEGPLVLVATQTIEVGVDLSFDALITEACSFEALCQRLGRLNRAGNDHDAQATLLAPAKKLSVTTEMIYGTHQVEAMLELLERQDTEYPQIDVSPRALVEMHATAEDLPLESPRPRSATLHKGLMPIMVQTQPLPPADIPVSALINGPDSEANRDVNVAWRAELAPLDVREGHHASPLNWEYVSVPLTQVRQFLLGSTPTAAISDLPEQSSDPNITGPLRDGARGNARVKNPEDKKWRILQSVDDLRPGSQLVLASSLGGYTNELGWDGKSQAAVDPVVVQSLRDDIRRQARQAKYRMPSKRFLPVTASLLAENHVDEATKHHIEALIEIATAYYQASQEGIVDTSITTDIVMEANALIRTITDDLGIPVDTSITSHIYDWGVLLPITPKGKRPPSRQDEEKSFLPDHLDQVGSWAASSARTVGMSAARVQDVENAGAEHDLGKMDRVFQESLGAEPDADASQMLAKSMSPAGQAFGSRRFQAEQAVRGWRHEAYSVLLVTPLLGSDPKLVRHLVGAHHGWYRPGFLPLPLRNNSAPAPTLVMHDVAHADDFLELNRKYGPWGLAYLETVVRLADWTASASPEVSGASQSASKIDILKRTPLEAAPVQEGTGTTDHLLSGLRDYPLVAWYASAGLLAMAEELDDDTARVSWLNEAGMDGMPPLTPVLTTGIPLEILVQAVHSSPAWATTATILHDYDFSPLGVKGQKIGPASRLREVLLQAERAEDSILLGSLSDAARADKDQRVALSIPAFANNSSYPQQAIETAGGGDESVMMTVKSLFDGGSGHTISTRDGGFERGAEFSPLANGREGYTSRYLRTSLSALTFFGMTALGTVPPSGLGIVKDKLILPLPENPSSFAELRALALMGNTRPNANWASVGNRWILTASRIFRKSSKTSSWAVTPTLRREQERK